MSGRVAIIQGDAFALLASLADGSVDHVITDPPYTSRSTRARTNRKGAAATGTGGDAGIAEGAGAWDADTLRRFRDECVRVSRRWVIIFCELESLGLFAEHPAFVRSMIWDRHSTPQMSGDRPAQPAEGLAIMHREIASPALLAAYDREYLAGSEAGASTTGCEVCDEHPAAMALLHREGRKRWNGGGKRGIYRHPIARGPQRAHPAQKPGALIQDLIRDFTDAGDRILDPCCGVGTIPVIVAAEGRDGIGNEADPRWFAMAQARAAGDLQWTAAAPSG